LATLDTIVAVPRHPAPDDRVVASELVVAGGGPAATAAVALARLGVPTYFVGNVGDDDVGDAIRSSLDGVDVSELATTAGARSPWSPRPMTTSPSSTTPSNKPASQPGTSTRTL